MLNGVVNKLLRYHVKHCETVLDYGSKLAVKAFIDDLGDMVFIILGNVNVLAFGNFDRLGGAVAVDRAALFPANPDPADFESPGPNWC